MIKKGNKYIIGKDSYSATPGFVPGAEIIAIEDNDYLAWCVLASDYNPDTDYEQIIKTIRESPVTEVAMVPYSESEVEEVAD